MSKKVRTWILVLAAVVLIFAVIAICDNEQTDQAVYSGTVVPVRTEEKAESEKKDNSAAEEEARKKAEQEAAAKKAEEEKEGLEKVEEKK